jgi:tetratricopeptide (TPR) repeat protein
VRAQGKAREALGYYVQALEMQQRIVPGDSPGAATLMNHVALARGRLGDRTAEKKLLDESLAMRRRLFGGDSGDDDHADIVQSLMNIGSWHHERNEFDRAFEFESQAVAMMRRLSPGDDMDLAVAIDNLGSTACDLGRDDESIALHREALAMERRLVSGDDPDVAQTLDELGVMYYRTDHPREALETLGEALHMRRRLHAGDHADIVTTLSHIGWTQEDLHETRSAIETYREALAMQLRLEPDGVVEVVAMHVHVARLFVELEEFEPARASFTAALVLGQELLPGSLSELAKALKGIGTLCERTRSWADSEAAVLTAGRGVHECKGLAPKARARALASVAAFYQAWNAAEPTAEREKSAAEWAEAR